MPRLKGLRVSATVLVLLSFLQACGQSIKTEIITVLSKEPHPRSYHFQVASTSNANTDLKLPTQLCYAIHVTGQGLNTLNESDDVCGPENGHGFLTERAYKVGEYAEMVLEPTDLARSFDLIGFESPLGLNADGKPNCGSSLSLKAFIDPTEVGTTQDTSGQIHSAFKLEIDGQAVVSPVTVFYSGEKERLNPGQEELTMYHWPKTSDSSVQGYSFGRPYLRQDTTSKDPICLATGEVPNQPPATNTSTEEFLSHSGAGLGGAIFGTSGTRELTVISTQSTMLPQVAAPANLEITGSTGSRQLLLGTPILVKEPNP